MFMMNTSSRLFRSFEELTAEGWLMIGNVFTFGKRKCLPLYEAKMFDIYNYRVSDIVISRQALKRPGQQMPLAGEELKDPTRRPTPRFWIDAQHVDEAIDDPSLRWLLAVAKVTSATNHRTFISTALLRAALTIVAICYCPMGRSMVQEAF